MNLCFFFIRIEFKSTMKIPILIDCLLLYFFVLSLPQSYRMLFFISQMSSSLNINDWSGFFSNAISFQLYDLKAQRKFHFKSIKHDTK